MIKWTGLLILCLSHIGVGATLAERVQQIPVLMYHDIVATDADAAYSDDVTAARFREQLQALAKQGFQSISLNAYRDFVLHAQPLDVLKPVLLTFDDGYIGNEQHARPLLEEFGVHAVFFVHTGFVGRETSKGHMSWEQLRALEEHPLFTVQSHTVKHRRLNQLPYFAIKKEVTKSKEQLAEQLDSEIYALAYPYGDHSPLIEAFTSEHYDLGFSVAGGHPQARTAFNIPRIGIGRATLTVADFLRHLRVGSQR